MKGPVLVFPLAKEQGIEERISKTKASSTANIGLVNEKAELCQQILGMGAFHMGAWV